MSSKSVTKQWGVRHPDGHVERISEVSANEGYMNAQQFATVRADTVGGNVVVRTITRTESDWKVGSRKELR